MYLTELAESFEKELITIDHLPEKTGDAPAALSPVFLQSSHLMSHYPVFIIQLKYGQLS